MVKDLATVIVSAVAGGAGFVGLVFYFIRRYIEGKLAKVEKENEERAKARTKIRVGTEEWEHAVGRLLFWITRAIETGEHNGELRKAHDDFEAADNKMKELDREIVAKYYEL